MTAALLLSLLAGAAIPLGGLLATHERIQPRWLELEFRHSVIAFGGGALLAAVALVLVPDGTRHLPGPWAVAAFGLGGLAFMLLDRLIAARAGSVAQFMAMLLDFVPEAIALGAAFAMGTGNGLLLALLITLQNGPEGFNAFREVRVAGHRSARHTLGLFTALALLGPAAAYAGMVWFAARPAILGGLMLFAAGGILYLTFQDIAPQAHLRRHWAPSLGAVLGFLLGLAGHLMTV